MRRFSGPMAVTCAIIITGGICYGATFSRFGPLAAMPTLAAVAIILVACLPPLAFSKLLSIGPACQLVIIGWRFGILLPALLLLRYWDGDERKCFLVALMACYFVALPLESWLLIRDLRQSSES